MVKEYIAVLDQLDSGDPTVTVFKNTLGGEMVWTRWNTGYHHGTMEGAFLPFGRVIYRKPSVDTDAAQYGESEAWLMRADDTQVTLIIKDATGQNVDACSNVPIEIIVYPEP